MEYRGGETCAVAWKRGEVCRDASSGISQNCTIIFFFSFSFKQRGKILPPIFFVRKLILEECADLNLFKIIFREH